MKVRAGCLGGQREGLSHLRRNLQSFSQERTNVQALQRKHSLTCLSKKASIDETKWVMKGVGGHKVLEKG